MSTEFTEQIFNRDAFTRVLGLAHYLTGLSTLHPGLAPVLKRLSDGMAANAEMLSRIDNDDQFFDFEFDQLRIDLVLVWELYTLQVRTMRRVDRTVTLLGSNEDKKELEKMKRATSGLLSQAEGLDVWMDRFYLAIGFNSIIEEIEDGVASLLSSARSTFHGMAYRLTRSDLFRRRNKV